MSILRLVRMLYSKRLIKEAIIIIQVMLLVCVYNLAITPFDTFNKSKNFVEKNFAINFDTDLLFLPSLSLGEEYFLGNSNTINEMITLIKEKSDILYMSEGNSVFEIGDKAMDATLNVYSDEMYNSIKFELIDEVFDESNLQIGEIPVYISNNLSKYYNIGDIIQIKSYNGENNEVPCRVAGILKNNAYIITTGTSENTLTHMISETENLIVAKYNNEYFKNAKIYPCFIIKNNNIKSELKDILKKHGELLTVNEIFEKNFLNILNNSEWNIMILLLLLIVIVFGYGGYLVVNNMQKRKLCSIFYICGMNLKKMIAIHIMSGFILFIPGIILGLFITPFFMEPFAYIKFTGYNLYTIMLIIGIIAFCFFTAIVLSAIQTKRITAIDLYKTNE